MAPLPPAMSDKLQSEKIVETLENDRLSPISKSDRMSGNPVEPVLAAKPMTPLSKVQQILSDSTSDSENESFLMTAKTNSKKTPETVLSTKGKN